MSLDPTDVPPDPAGVSPKPARVRLDLTGQPIDRASLIDDLAKSLDVEPNFDISGLLDSNSSKTPPSGCAICSEEDNLLLCSACRVVHYCSADHQIEHRPVHKAACKAIKIAREKVEIEEKRFQEAERDSATTLSFSNYPSGNSFVVARVLLFDALTAIFTKASLQAQLDNLLRLFFLGPSHVPFARFYCQSLMLRLGKDQECYDFTVWFQSVIDVPDHEWARIGQEGVGIHGADPLEDCRMTFIAKAELDLMIHQIVIKARCYFNLMAVEEMNKAFRPKLPPDMLRGFMETCLTSSILKARPELLDGENPSHYESTMKLQIVPMMHAVFEQNRHYWPALFAPDALKHMNHVPRMQSWISNNSPMDSPEFAEDLVKITIGAWCATPGPLELIREKWHGWRHALEATPPGTVFYTVPPGTLDHLRPQN